LGDEYHDVSPADVLSAGVYDCIQARFVRQDVTVSKKLSYDLGRNVIYVLFKRRWSRS
jgi:hypothetical protein